jgi:hypothetical protein
MGQAAVEDADELVGQFAASDLRGVRSWVMGVVVGPGPRRAGEGREGLGALPCRVLTGWSGTATV